MMKFSHAKLALGAACLAFLFSSCVAREHYQTALDSSKHYQKAYLESDRQRAELAEENARLKRMLSVSESMPVQASGEIEAIDKRLMDLNNKLAELGSHPGDVMKFAVDGGNLYQVTDAILFDLGSATLTPEGLKVLETVARDIDSTPHGQISVRGHTDNVPVSRPETKAKFPHGNLQLSAERAVEVAAALQGIVSGSSQDLVVMGFGESLPVTANDSPENRRKNRRVEIFVANPDGAKK
ncbi:MAG: OmpA family protein [Planctomycetes bacterium]|nr:OmpA family protein [Planctomycetota bacterium]